MTDVVASDGVRLHAVADGPPDAPALVLATPLATTVAVWDPLLQHLPEGLRIIRYDLRGHGQSDVPDGPYTMGQMIGDAEAVCDAFEVRDAVFLGLSVGGLIAQGIAVKRPDIVRALILAHTAVKIDNPAAWQAKIATVEAGGMSAFADFVIRRMFGQAFYGSKDMPRWLDMFMKTDTKGFVGVCAAIAGTDFYATTAKLRIPTLGIAGSDDKAIPPDMVRETIDLIPGSQFVLMRKVGHLPCVEDSDGFAAIIARFLADIGHFPVPDVDH